MTQDEERKRAVGFAAVDRYVRAGMCIGLGSGSTAHWATARVGERVAAGERIVAVPTSSVTERQCRELGIPLVALGEQEIDVAIDGADEVAADWSLTKGAGGAMFREKAVALAAETFVVIVTPEKLVKRLGAFPTPVEVVPFALATVVSGIAAALPHVRIKQRKIDLAPLARPDHRPRDLGHRAARASRRGRDGAVSRFAHGRRPRRGRERRARADAPEQRRPASARLGLTRPQRAGCC
jgi:ribose 5-phosphate isomerase